MGSYRLYWLPLCGGEIALGHKPGKKLRHQLEKQGCTLVVNLLSDLESKASENEHRVRLPLRSARPPGAKRDAEVYQLFERMLTELHRGGRVFVHCSAGLHRTGMIAFAFFRHLGFAREESIQLIRELRELTASQLTEPRITWGEKFAKAIKEEYV